MKTLHVLIWSGLVLFVSSASADTSIRFDTDTFYVVNEPTSQDKKLKFNVIREGDLAGEVQVEFATSADTATAGADYNDLQITLTFADGQSSVEVAVDILADNLDEENERFNISLSNPTNGAVLGSPSDTYVQINDSSGPPKASIADVTVQEPASGTAIATFTIQLDRASGKTITANYSTHNGTAIAGSDFDSVSGQATFAPGETSKTIDVSIRADADDESEEQFSLKIDSYNTGGLDFTSDFEGLGIIPANSNSNGNDNGVDNSNDNGAGNSNDNGAGNSNDNGVENSNDNGAGNSNDNGGSGNDNSGGGNDNSAGNSNGISNDNGGSSNDNAANDNSAGNENGDGGSNTNGGSGNTNSGGGNNTNTGSSSNDNSSNVDNSPDNGSDRPTIEDPGQVADQLGCGGSACGASSALMLSLTIVGILSAKRRYRHGV